MKNIIPSYVRVPLIFAIVFGGMEYFIDSGEKPAFIEYPMVAVFLGVFLFLLLAIEITVSAVDNITYNLLTDEQKKQLEEAQSLPFTEGAFYKKLMNKLTRTRSIDEEGQLLLDHDYDGIKELDNVLPPWWVYMFYGTIIFAGVYLVRFEVLSEYSQAEEYEMAMEDARIAIEEYKKTAKDLVDASNVVVLTEASDLAAGKKVFETNCVSCHRADGGGGIGPNLTDQHWILGGGIKNIFNTLVKGGRDGKGMVSWQGILKPSEMQQVGSYILSLQGTNPADAKAAEGEIWVDESQTVNEALNTSETEESGVEKDTLQSNTEKEQVVIAQN
uniref:cbb3-type cytochrome c oxidase N-terminal domain-containing protein n=1 Tax=Flavobacterium sp. TaxID=239 RepID=UPI00404AB43E